MNVLLATDGSEEARSATRMAAAIAKRTGSELCVVHVVDPGAAADPRLQVDRQQQARALLDEQAREISESYSITVRDQLAMGRPDREIVALAGRVGAGLIVVGSRGLGGVRRALMGSVSESVVRHASCPVLVVR